MAVSEGFIDGMCEGYLRDASLIPLDRSATSPVLTHVACHVALLLEMCPDEKLPLGHSLSARPSPAIAQCWRRMKTANAERRHKYILRQDSGASRS